MRKLRLLVYAALPVLLVTGAYFDPNINAHQRERSARPMGERIRVDERGMLAALGVEPESTYNADGVKGLQFYNNNMPAFVLQFGAGRTKVAWLRPQDESVQPGAEASVNDAWAQRVLRYALGATGSAQVLESVAQRQQAVQEIYGHTVEVNARGYLAVVTIFH